MTIIRTLLTDACAHGIDPADAAILLGHVLAVTRADMIAHDDRIVTATDTTRFAALCDRRAAGEPVAYLTGTKEFYGRDFAVTPTTLIPRPDTETLVDRALAVARAARADDPGRPVIIADIGTGSGAIIVTLAAELAAGDPGHRYGFIATDTSVDALTVADANARTLDVDQQIAFIHDDLLRPLLRSEPLRRLARSVGHVVLCANLPYVDSAQRRDLLSRPESRALAFEPADALWADDGGLAVYDRFLEQVALLAADAPVTPLTALCEIAPDQDAAMTTLVRRHLPDARTTVVHDLSGRPRVVEIVLPSRQQRS